jgi:peptidoglycan/LPS O-acetylase OafA/YrhL
MVGRSMSVDANATGARPTLGHLEGLDGIRAFAVLSIIAFHTGLNSVPGGFYGVDVLGSKGPQWSS